MSESRSSYKKILYSILFTLAGVSAFLFVCGVIFAVLKAFLWQSIWMFGMSSNEILPVLLPLSFLLMTLPLAVIIFFEKKKYKTLMLILMPVLVAASSIWCAVAVLKAPSYYYTMNSSPDGYYTVVIAEPKDASGSAVLYQLLDDGFTMKLMSSSACVAVGERPFTNGYAKIEWNMYAFTVTYTDPQTGAVSKQIYTCSLE